MKLIKISKSKNIYEIKTLISYKLLGKRLISIERSFVKKENEDDWYEKQKGLKASEVKRLKLERWLRDHQKFIEKL
ncbi:hypothetical protein [Christiangramia sediminis]|uniref:Uncharacterized protein n=1 Tax=Christiangramia sediminis TaxID=2881336 RepID=A0A9X1LH71_9FLAO|nr:hypothetical protein [Christiangramia sediminis]MCB7480264.1 hypothetical protein [Christiangramia sediminis]